ncbi:MAG: L-lactate permease, partial [Bacteroidota bacterium]
MRLAVLALAGSVPIVVVFVLLVGFRWSAVRAMAVGWAIASALGLFLWQMDTVWWAASALYGALQAIEIIIIVFGAILLMNHLEGSGAVTTIRWHFTQITEDRRAQLLLIGLGFITLIEGAAGFGTPGALAAPLLIGLGFPPLAAAVFGLMFNAPQPPFGAAGTPVIGGIAAVIDENVLAEGQELPAFLEAVTGWTALFTGTALVFWGLLGVFLLAFWFGNEEERSFRGALRVTLPVAPLAVTLGILAGGTQAVVAWLFGPELPDIAAGFVILGAGVTLVRFGMFVPDETWTFPDRQTWSLQWFGGEKKKEEVEDVVQESTRTMPVIMAWTPYILVALILVVTRWPGLGIVGWLQQQSLDIPRILGEELSFSLRYLYLPGVVPFIPVALLTALIHRMRPATVAAAWR